MSKELEACTGIKKFSSLCMKATAHEHVPIYTEHRARSSPKTLQFRVCFKV